MDFILLCWLFALAVTLHNLEEALWLPAWSRSAGQWHHPMGVREFRFAVAVLTAFAYLAAYLATVGGKESVGAYLVAGYAFVMLLNVLFPHVLASLVMRRYAPGTATALLLNLPITLVLIYQGLEESYVRREALVWVALLVLVAIAAAIPALFAIGRWQPKLRES